MLTVLAPQLLVTFGLAAMFVRVSSFSAYAHRNPGTFGFSLSVMCAMMLALVFCCNLRKKSPDKYIVLLVVAICEAYMLGDMSYCKEALDVTIALTMVVLMGLSVLASWVRWWWREMEGRKKGVMEREGGRDVCGRKERGIHSKYDSFLFLGEKLVVEGNRGKGKVES